MDSNKVQKFFKYAIDFLLIICWGIMMFSSSYLDSIGFDLLLLITVVGAMIYSIVRKKYFPTSKTGKYEKILAVILIISLFIRMIIK